MRSFTRSANMVSKAPVLPQATGSVELPATSCAPPIIASRNVVCVESFASAKAKAVT